MTELLFFRLFVLQISTCAIFKGAHLRWGRQSSDVLLFT
jgi:hypothetical protein